VSRIITNARALDAQFVPSELNHRTAAIEELRAALRPVVDGYPAEHICLYGPAGVGKTTLAKHMVSQLERSVPAVRWGYVNCIRTTGQRNVLHSLLHDIESDIDLCRRGTDAVTLDDRLRAIDDPVIAIIDEISLLTEMETLNALYEVPTVTVIAITIDEHSLLTDVNNLRLESRFRSARTITLDQYTHTELRDIVTDRARMGLRSGVVTDEAFHRIATTASGDARLGIALLRKSAYAFPETDANRITADLVDSITSEALRDIRERYLSLLNTQQRLLFRIIDEAGEIPAPELHRAYERQSDDPRSKSMRRRYLQSLQEYRLIESTGTGRGTTYQIRRH